MRGETLVRIIVIVGISLVLHSVLVTTMLDATKDCQIVHLLHEDEDRGVSYHVSLCKR